MAIRPRGSRAPRCPRAPPRSEIPMRLRKKTPSATSRRWKKFFANDKCPPSQSGKSNPGKSKPKSELFPCHSFFWEAPPRFFPASRLPQRKKEHPHNANERCGEAAPSTDASAGHPPSKRDWEKYFFGPRGKGFSAGTEKPCLGGIFRRRRGQSPPAQTKEWGGGAAPKPPFKSPENSEEEYFAAPKDRKKIIPSNRALLNRDHSSFILVAFFFLPPVPFTKGGWPSPRASAKQNPPAPPPNPRMGMDMKEPTPAINPAWNTKHATPSAFPPNHSPPRARHRRNPKDECDPVHFILDSRPELFTPPWKKKN